MSGKRNKRMRQLQRQQAAAQAAENAAEHAHEQFSLIDGTWTQRQDDASCDVVDTQHGAQGGSKEAQDARGSRAQDSAQGSSKEAQDAQDSSAHGGNLEAQSAHCSAQDSSAQDSAQDIQDTKGNAQKESTMDEVINGFTGFAQKNTQQFSRFADDSSVKRVNEEKEEEKQEQKLAFDPEKLAEIEDTDRRWAWLEIDLNAIRHNVLQAKHIIGRNCRLCAVVKADAYGHGAVRVAKTALNSGAEYLAVATVQEGIELREAYVNAPILLLCQPPKTAIPLLLGYKIMPSIYTAEFAIQYAEVANAYGVSAPYHLAINTGMNRIGVKYDNVVEFLRQINFHQSLELAGVFTHFATADCPEVFDFDMQGHRFVDAVNAIVAAGINPGIVHAANSAALVRYPGVHFDMARLGISLYGLQSCEEARPLIDLKPAMSVHARITDTRTLSVGDGVSYGLHYRSSGGSYICTLPLGYADGFRRDLSGKANIIYNGTLHPQVGNICMDQCMFEYKAPRDFALRRTPEIGDEVLIVGKQGNAEITLDHMADTLGTITHELAIHFAHRMPRIYV